MAAFPDPADGAPEARFAAASSYASLRDDDDEGMGDDDADSLLFRDEPDVWKSVTSSVRQHSHYNGRWYNWPLHACVRVNEPQGTAFAVMLTGATGIIGIGRANTLFPTTPLSRRGNT